MGISYCYLWFENNLFLLYSVQRIHYIPHTTLAKMVQQNSTQLIKQKYLYLDMLQSNAE